jgi:peptide/nickel transport system substrate-binding protein
VTADTQEYRKAAEIIAGYWQEIGVKTSIEYVPVKDMARSALKDRSYDVLLYGFILGSDPDQFAFWHSSQVTYPGLNLAQYSNRDVDALLSQARETTDENKVAELYGKIQEKILADRPAIFLYSPTYTYATLDKVKGIDLSRISVPADRFADITEWYLKTRGQWKW